MSEHKHRWMSPLGDVLLSATDDALTGFWFSNQKYAPDSSEFTATAKPGAIIELTMQWLDAYFETFEVGKPAKNLNIDVELPALAPKGTDFQQQVWQALIKIPTGKTLTYAQLAKSIAKPEAVRAVAAAIGRNPISIIIPCHRVIGANGSLTGYAGGLDRKQSLLAHEGASMQHLLPV